MSIDLALLKLDEPVEISKQVQIACLEKYKDLSSENLDFSGDSYTAVGWKGGAGSLLSEPKCGESAKLPEEQSIITTADDKLFEIPLFQMNNTYCATKLPVVNKTLMLMHNIKGFNK